MRLAVGALLAELGRHHEIRYIGYRASDQLDVPEDSAMRLIDLPPRPIRGVTLLRATLRRRPWEADRLAAGLHRALRHELDTFDPQVVHVIGWVLAGLGRVTADVGSVLTPFDAWHLNVEASAAVADRLRRPLIRAEASHIRRFEAEEFQHFGRVVVVSQQDKAALQRLNPGLRITVIPNGVDAEFFSGAAAHPILGRIVFTGAMNYPPNIAAASFLARHLLPRVRAVRPDTQLVIVGREPDRRVLDLAALDGVEVTGAVEDIRPWLQSAQVFVCPMLSGTGIKNKLLEAMASGLPCVATPLALQGLSVSTEQQVLVGETEKDLADQICRVLNDDKLARRLGRAAREYVRASHSWPRAAQRYDDVYRDVQPLRDSSDELAP